MGMGIFSVQHNMSALFTNRQLKITNGSIHKTEEKLASGYRINRSADDAAGLAISEKMRKQIRGLTQASQNLQDGVSLSQVADGALAEVHDMIHRINELAIKAANGTLSKDDREWVNDEVKALKKEMSRVFKTTKFNEVEIFRTVEMIYNPEIEEFPTDMGVFHTGSGGIGGLEFNNVRYNISELQALGFSIDNNGVATADFEAEFNLWDGERVKISMKEGANLNSAVRNYNWEATPKGININGVLAAEWSDMEVDGVVGALKKTTTFPSGEYSFTHHGMKITFEVDTELDINEMMERINGNEDIPPATWDVSVGAMPLAQSADIVDATSTKVIQVTEANKAVINNVFNLVADENGLAVKNNTTGFQTAYVAWETFKDSSLADIKDENGNPIKTNGGYPIVDWGGDAPNNESAITFDANATYHFVSPDPDVQIEFDFKLAESASLREVMDALNGVNLSTNSVVVSGTVRASSAGIGTVTRNAHAIETTFTLQRLFGRNFDVKNDTLTGSMTVERNVLDGYPSATDRPDGTGEYASGRHTVTRTLSDRTRDSHNEATPAAPVNVTIQAETYTDYVLDAGGNKIPLTDGEGNPIDGEYLTEERVRWHFFEEYDVECTEVYTNTYDATDRWTQRATYTFDGEFTGKDMDSVTRNQDETYERSLTQTRKETYTYTRKEIREVAYDNLNSYVKAFIDADDRFAGDTVSSVSDSFDVNSGGNTISVNVVQAGTYDTSILNGSGAISGQNSTYADFNTPESGVGEATLVRVGTTTFSNVAFRNNSGSSPYSINYAVTLDQARALTETSGPVDIATIRFTTSSFGTRTFNPNEISASIREAEFSSVNVNDVILDIPPRSLIIQSGADSDDQIEMQWSPLNLWALGLYRTKVLTMEGAEAAINETAKALEIISGVREKFGAYQNRFEHAIKMTDNTVENTTYAESRIRDTDMAKEMVKFSNSKIVAQAGQAMLASANQSKNVVLSLLNS